MFMVTVIVAAILTPVLPSMAATTGRYQRLDCWNCKHRTYKVANVKADTYTFSGIKPKKEDLSGEIKSVKLKVNHHLKNYKHEIWTRTRVAQIKHNGNWMVYYFVKTKKHHASGWVRLMDVKRKHPTKRLHAYNDPDFDAWYRTTTQKQRNNYPDDTGGGASDVFGDPVLPAFWDEK